MKVLRAIGVATMSVAAVIATASSSNAAPVVQQQGHAMAQALAQVENFDFRVPGVRIWSQPSANSIINGLGYPGQGFVVDHYRITEAYTCDNGAYTIYWAHGRNSATGVTGYVPDCNLV